MEYWAGGRRYSSLEQAIASASQQKEQKMNIKGVILGSHYADRYTGFTGVCTAACQYQNGKDSAFIEPRLGEGQWIEVARLDSNEPSRADLR